VLLRRDTSKEAELLVLRHENAVLRRQITGPVRYEPADRFWFAALSSLLPPTPLARHLPGHPRHTAGLASPVHHREVGLHRTSSAYRTPIHPLHHQETPPTPDQGKPPMGHRRIHGELTRLGHHIAASTVWEILNTEGIDPAPRRRGLTWKESLTSQARGIIAVDFFTSTPHSANASTPSPS
jgi:putative transposase